MLQRNYDTRWYTTYFNTISKNLYLILCLDFVYVRLRKDIVHKNAIYKISCQIVISINVLTDVKFHSEKLRNWDYWEKTQLFSHNSH